MLTNIHLQSKNKRDLIETEVVGNHVEYHVIETDWVILDFRKDVLNRFKSGIIDNIVEECINKPGYVHLNESEKIFIVYDVPEEYKHLESTHTSLDCRRNG